MGRKPKLSEEERKAAYDEHIRKTVDAAPPLTAEARSRLAELLRPADGSGVSHGR
jgi:hypothetical protein